MTFLWGDGKYWSAERKKIPLQIQYRLFCLLLLFRRTLKRLNQQFFFVFLLLHVAQAINLNMCSTCAFVAHHIFSDADTPIAKLAEDKDRKNDPIIILYFEPCGSENMPPLVGFLLFSAFCFPRSFFLSVASSRLCSHQCICYEHAELVDCRGRGFEHVPRGVPHGTWLLELGGNNLSQIGSHAFTGLWSLRVLMLSNSQIQEIQPLVWMIKHCVFLVVGYQP